MTESSTDSLLVLTEFCPEQYCGFFSGNPMLHTELPYQSQYLSAIPLPYRLCRDDMVSGSLLLCLFMLVYIVKKKHQQLVQQMRDFFYSPRERTGLPAVETGTEARSRLFTVCLLSLIGGLFMFIYTQQDLHIMLGEMSSRQLLAIYVGSLLLFFAVRHMMSRFVNWIFFPKSLQKQWNENYFLLFSVESLLLFPLLLASVYFILPFEKLICFFLFILLIIKILLTFKTYNIFFHKSYCQFHLFAYLCALEIMPLLALWKALAIVTESLIVKY